MSCESRRSIALVFWLLAAPAGAAELHPATVAAFDRYVALAEARIDVSGFSWLDSLPPSERQTTLDRIARGQVAVERLQLRDRGREIEVPDGLIHHWVGAVFVPGGSVDEAVGLLQDYDRHAAIYAPAVARSAVLERDGDRFRVFLRFVMTKVITVVVNSEHDVRFTREHAGRVRSRLVSTRIAELARPGTADEREEPVGRDGGYLWRLNTYWRFVEGGGGVSIECESISLTRGIPFGLGWVVKPFVTSIPRESLSFTLETTRRVLVERRR